MTKEIGQARKQETAVVEILRRGGTEVMRQQLRYSFGIILLHDPTNDILAYGHSYGFSPEQQKVMESSSLLASAAWEESKIWEVFRSQKSVALGKLSKDLPANPDVARLNATLQIESFACAPIVCDSSSLGVLLVGYFYSDADASIRESNISLLVGIAPVLGVTLRNAGLIQEKEFQLGEILALEESRP